MKTQSPNWTFWASRNQRPRKAPTRRSARVAASTPSQAISLAPGRSRGVGVVPAGHDLIGAVVDGQETRPTRGEAALIGQADVHMAVVEPGDQAAHGPPPAAGVRRLRPLTRLGQTRLDPLAEGRVAVVICRDGFLR